MIDEAPVLADAFCDDGAIRSSGLSEGPVHTHSFVHRSQFPVILKPSRRAT